MLRVCRDSGNLIAEISFPQYKEIRRVTISQFLILGQDCGRLLQPIIDRLNLLNPNSIVGQLEGLKWLGDALRWLEITHLPMDDVAWQELVVAIHRFVFTRKDRKVSLKTRCTGYWQSIHKVLSDLIEDGVIPVSVALPSAKENLHLIDISPYYARLLGQSVPEMVQNGTVDKLLVSISIARRDAEYLEEVRDLLAFRRRLLFDCLKDYWSKVKANYEFGKGLLATVNWDTLKKELEREAAASSPVRNLANAFRGREGLANYLAVCKYVYGGFSNDDSSVLRAKSPDGVEFIKNINSLNALFAAHSELPLPPSFVGVYRHAERQAIHWWLGQLITIDVAMIAALLTMIHPSWTPFSLLRATLTTVDGKLQLGLADTGATFSIDKARAQEMKTEVLDDLSLEIFTTVIEMSAPLRARLAAENDPRAPLLFLPVSKSRNDLTLPTMATGSYVLGGTNDHSVWVGALYPELVTHGLGKGTISLSKIRHTEGVLEWFRTGSLKAMRQKLGNTEKVVLTHYLPKPLLDAWNVRMVRRFQNLWIAVAAANEPFLLDVTDFTNLTDLHAFLKDMLDLHSRTSSELAKILHDEFGFLRGETQSGDVPQGCLHVSVSKASLSALYTYHANVVEAGAPPAVLDTPDAVTGLSPRQFLALADLLLQQLSEDKNPAVRTAHEAALEVARDPSRRSKWGRLFCA
jgi:hypothetical protein